MARYVTAATTLSAALGLALGLCLAPVSAQDKATSAQSAKDKMEKCYGINAVGKNDCASGANSCAGQSTKARDPKAYVLLPAGACTKIAGGKTSPS